MFNYLEKSLLTRDESASLKGLLIFLIVLGHNSLFCNAIDGFHSFIYCFHVQCFFVLPFLYPSKSLSVSSIKDNFFRLYWPFIIIFILYSIVFKIVAPYLPPQGYAYFLSDNDGGIVNCFRTILTGNWFMIEFFSGFQYLWFLPVMFSCLVWKQIVEYATICHKKATVVLLMALSLVCYVMFFVFMYHAPYGLEINHGILQFSLFGALQGLGIVLVSYIIRAICERYNDGQLWIWVLLFCVSLIWYVITLESAITIWVLRGVMPIIFFVILFGLRKQLSSFNLLKKIGDNSFLIYIIHPVFCKFFVMLTPEHLSINWVYIIMSQILIIVMSYYLAKFINNMEIIRRTFFPKKSSDFILSSIK